MELKEYFDRIFVINLPERKDRLKGILRELKKINISLSFPKLEVFPAIKPRASSGFPSLEARGCFLSHLSVLKKAKEAHFSKILILEDDLVFSRWLNKTQGKLVKQLDNKQWGFAYLGHNLDLHKNNSVKLLTYSQDIRLTHFYGVNGMILDGLIHFLEVLQKRETGHPEGGPMHLDGAYSTFRKQNSDIITLVSCPSMGRQGSSPSNIFPRFYDRVFFLKQLVYIIRKCKEAIRRFYEYRDYK